MGRASGHGLNTALGKDLLDKLDMLIVRQRTGILHRQPIERYIFNSCPRPNLLGLWSIQCIKMAATARQRRTQPLKIHF